MRALAAAPAKARMVLAAIRFEHSVFALPFAYIGMFLAADGLPTLSQFIWITVAMVGARTVAMTANRLVHAKEDAANPRTKGRHIPLGRLRGRDMLVMMLVAMGVFVFAASQLNTLALVLSPLVIAVLFLYTYAKYFTWGSHFVLGWADAIAPAGAWVGVTGTLDWQPVLLALAVASWVSGFDIIYACMDYDFDGRYGVRSIPRKFGVAGALLWARGLHVVTSASLLAVGVWMNLGVFYFLGWGVATALLVYQNLLVRPGDLSKVPMASLKLSSYVGIALLIATSLAVFL